MSSRPSGGLLRGRAEHPDARVSRNLHNLAAAAKQFHSAASSTSGTTRAGSSAPWHSIPPLSLIGDLPEHTRQRVEAFIQAGGYTSPETLSITRQPSLRTPSPVSSHHSTLPTPREAPSVNNDSAPASEPTQEVSEIDEDEEIEDEWEYFDGLRDLARDRIVKQDYAKAIEFINQALAKADIIWNGDDDVFVQLQVQLALCHFFSGHWRSAEPIVLKLTASDLNEVTCNLLHALSLAHLFEYSMDSALRLCRKALKGKKDILENDQELTGGPLEADYGNTLALCSTIYHMKGDPIRAEVFYRRLPRGFEYKHPSSELEFIINHPRLLPAVLGDDIPHFDTGRSENEHASPESFFVFGWETAPQDAQKLYKGPPVANSLLRQRFARHELYESDTDKVVIEGPSPCSPTDSGVDMTADDELSFATALNNLVDVRSFAPEEAISEEATVGDSPSNGCTISNSPSSEGNSLIRPPHMTSSTDSDTPDTSSSNEASATEPMADNTVSSEPSSESTNTDREGSPVRLPLRRRVTRMFSVRRPRHTPADHRTEPPLTCPPEPSATSSGWFHNPSRPGASRSKTVSRKSSNGVGSQEEAKAGTRGRTRTLKLGPMELTFKKTARVLQAPAKTSDVDALPVVDDDDHDTCAEKQLEDRYRSGVFAAGPPRGKSKRRLAGLLTEYYGPDPSVGPYTCDEKRWPDPHRQLLTAATGTVPHGPSDVVAAVEMVADALGGDEVATTSGPSKPSVKGKQRLRLDTGVVNDEQLHHPARCRAGLPGRLASVLTSLPAATATAKQAVRSELEELLEHVRTCLNDGVLEADLRRIVASLGTGSAPSGSNDGGPAPRVGMGSEGACSPDSNCELFLWRGSSLPAVEPPPRGSAKQLVDCLSRPDGDTVPSPRNLAPRHLFGSEDESNFKFIMPNELIKRNVGGGGGGCLAVTLATQGAQTPRSPAPAPALVPAPAPPQQQLLGDKGSSSARPDLQRAFSFVAGDDARYSCRGGGGGGGDAAAGAGKGLEPQEEEDTTTGGLEDGASSGSSPVQKKQVSWAPADLVVPAVSSN